MKKTHCPECRHWKETAEIVGECLEHERTERHEEVRVLKACHNPFLGKLINENDRLREELEQEQVQHAGCLTYAEGWGGVVGPLPKDAYGYSEANNAVRKLREEYEKLKGTVSELIAAGEVLHYRADSDKDLVARATWQEAVKKAKGLMKEEE